MHELIHSFDPLLKALSVFGFLPFKLNFDGSSRVSVFHISYSISLVFIFGYLIYLRISHFNDYQLEGSFLSKISFLIGVIETELFLFATIGLNLFNRKGFDFYFKAIWQFDCEVSLCPSGPLT